MKITFSPNFFINLPFVFSGLSTAADCEHSVGTCAQGAWTENQKLNVNPKPVWQESKWDGRWERREFFFFFTVTKRIWEDETFCAALFFFFPFCVFRQCVQRLSIISYISYISPSLLQALTCLFKQESSSLTEEETLSRSTLGQDREPDKQPGAHGERSANCTDTQQRLGGAHSSSLCSSFQVQDLEFAQIERKVIDGLKVGNECLKKMHEVGDDMWPADAFNIHHLLLMSCYQLFFTAGDVY